MRKLLTILGAVGLTATTGATVVACGDKNIDKKNDIDAVLQNETIQISEATTLIIRNYNVLKNTLHNFKVVADKIDNKDQEIIFFSDNIHDSGVFELEANGIGSVTFHIEAEVIGKQEEGKPEVKVSGNMTINVIKASIKNIKLIIEEKTSKADVEKAILGAVQDEYGRATANDYTVSEIKEIVEPGDKITVTAKTDSNCLSGEFEFSVIVTRINISDLTVDVKAGTSKADVKKAILAVVKTKHALATENDYTVKEFEDPVKANDTIYVAAKGTSTFIKGSFSFTVKP